MVEWFTVMDLLKVPPKDLIAQADKVRRESIGDRFDLCTITNAKSGLCSEDCKFCAQSSCHSTTVSRYPLKNKRDIIKEARDAKAIGAARFGIVTSGNKLTARELENIAYAISEIKDKIGIEVCASLGALDKLQLKMLKSAGLSRYHHNIETSPNFYPKVVTTHSFKERVDAIENAKSLGFKVCSGGIIGMGETWQDRVDMAELLKRLNVDSVPINFLVPIKGTSLESVKPISCNDAIRTIAIFRIILQTREIKIAAGRESVLKDAQAQGFGAGANGMLIGGYLTVKGRPIGEDQVLIKEIERLWQR